MHLTNRSKVRCFKISNGVGTRSINIWVRILGHFNQIEIIDMALENLGTTYTENVIILNYVYFIYPNRTVF